MDIRNTSPTKLGIIIAALFASIASPFVITGLVEDLDAKEIMVVQSPVSGDLTVYTEPGLKWQGWGTVTKYPRRDQYSFSASKDQGKLGDQSIATGFNDGGTGKVSGVMSWEPPLKPEQLIRLHKEYGSLNAIDQQLIRPMLEKVIFSAGATMSSIESSSERRPEIPQTIDDQLRNGPYLTKVVTITTKDILTGKDTTKNVVQLVTSNDGKIQRASESTIKEYGITLSPVTINHIEYEASVKAQIAERQKSTQAVQLSQAAAIRATQDAITTEQQGKANAAKAKWEQETINAKEIALSEKSVVVAKNEALAAEQYKRKLILEGEGESAKKRMVMEADGALEKKLETYAKVQGYWATAFQNYNGNIVPTVQMGNSSAASGNTGVQQLMEVMAAKAAKDLSVDLQAAGANKTVKK